MNLWTLVVTRGNTVDRKKRCDALHHIGSLGSCLKHHVIYYMNNETVGEPP